MAERNCIELRGVDFQLKKFSSETEIKKSKDRICERLNRFTDLCDVNRDTHLRFYDFEKSHSFNHEDGDGNEIFGLSMKASDFYIDSISFFRDRTYSRKAYVMSICGVGYHDDLFLPMGSELQIIFEKYKNELSFKEVQLVGLANHSFSSVSTFPITEKSKNKILAIADKATEVFTKMSTLPH